MSNVGYARIHSWWNGRVLIDELKEYKDSRGMLCELWRTDDDVLPNATMSYWSETDPYVLRGPHEHVAQRDGFITWRSRMLYILHDKQTNETKSFVTDPSKITRVMVDPTVVHCYRNLDPKRSLTGNFPTSLFMGQDKKEKIDEIRHEENLKGKKLYVILGAGGRLGKAVTKKFLDNIGFYDFEVIPVYHRITDSPAVVEALDAIQKAKGLTEASDVTVINCIGVTNVQESSDKDKNLFWANSDMPYILGEYCSRRSMKLINISSDYVYQEVKPTLEAKISPYTRSKKIYEDMLKESLDSGSKVQAGVRVLRVANLFSSDVTDENNLIQKIYKNVKKYGEVKYDPEIEVGLTHVDVVADWIYDNKDTLDARSTFTNLVSPDVYNIRDLLIKYFDGYAKRVQINVPYKPWFNNFRYSSEAVELKSSDEYIKNLISALKNI